jgi:hypothetical protein
MKRPLGITIIAVLAIIGAVLGLFAAVSVLGVSGLAFLNLASTSSSAVAVGSTLGLTLGIVWMISAVLQLVFGIGALQLKSWAWTLGVVLYSLTLLNYLVALFTVGVTMSVVIGIVVVGVIMAYLFTHDVRKAFGHLPASTSGTPMVTH